VNNRVWFFLVMEREYVDNLKHIITDASCFLFLFPAVKMITFLRKTGIW